VPTEGALDDPSARQVLKPFGIFWAFHDFQDPSEMAVDHLNDGSVSPIGPNQLQAAPAIIKAAFYMLELFLQSKQSSSSILQTGTMNYNQQNRPQGVHDQVPLASWGLLMHIHTTFFAAFRSFDTLAVYRDEEKPARLQA
jgi:hypothetical protein